MKPRAIAILLLATAALAAPATAAADDQSLVNTYAHSHYKRLKAAAERYDRAIRRVDRSGGRDTRAARVAIRQDERIATIVGAIADELRRDSSSSPDGERAKGLGIKAYLTWRMQVRYDARALRLALRGSRASDRWLRRAIRARKRWLKLHRQTRAAFEAAGVEPQPPPS